MAAEPPAAPSPVAFREDSADAGPEFHVLLLLVSGTTPRSSRAIVNARQFCERHLAGRYELEVIDISLRPEVATAEQIVAAPTLIRTRPLPRRHFIGDLSESERLRAGLGLDADPDGNA